MSHSSLKQFLCFGCITVALLALAACGGESPAGGTSTPTTAPQGTSTYTQSTPTSTSTSNENTIQIIGSAGSYAFSPAELTVKAGTTVTWHGSSIHTIVSDDGKFNLTFEGPTVQYTFKDPGTYKYHCGVHTYMKGTIIVQ
jgi:plastocyanin